MIARKTILLLTVLLVWLGGVGDMWAQEVSQSGENNYVKYLCSSLGFNIQFKYNGQWQMTTYSNGGYKTVVEMNETRANICSGSFKFGHEYLVHNDKVGVTIVASINPTTPWAVNIKYTIRNTTDEPIENLKIGSWADTKVGDDDAAKIERVGHNTIMMTAINNTSAGAMYGITAGSDPFTTLWYGYYGNAENKVFTDNGGVDGQGVYDGSSSDSGLAWSWTIENLPANGTKEITFGGLAPAVRMSGYKYAGTLSTPTVSIEGNPAVTYYYNTIDQNSEGTLWTNVTSSTTLDPGVYYMYAYVEPEGEEPYNTPTTPFRVAKGDYDMSGVTFSSNSFPYDGNSHSLAISGTLPADVSVSYNNNGRTDAGSQTVTAVFTTSNSTYYNNPPSRTATLTITKRAITTTAITVVDLAYDASEHTTADQVTVKVGDVMILTENYTVEPATVTEAGTYTLTITGRNNLTGVTTADLRVTKDMNGTYADDFTVSDIPTQIYKGAALQPTVSVYDNGRLLTPTVDYTVSYGDNNEEGIVKGTITINGAGAYTGSLNRTFDIVNEYFKVGEIVYRATSSTTVAVVDKAPDNPTVTTTATGAVTIPATVEHIVADAFQVTGIMAGAFKNRTDIRGISMPHTTVYLTYIEDGAFEGCTALRYIDLCNAKNFTPTCLERTVAASPFYGVPKQALVYLNGIVIAGENYVYKPGNESNCLCDEFKIYDDVNGSQTGFAGSDYEWPFENLHNFKAKYITNTRMFVAGQHYTLCLPYDMTIPESFKVYQLVGANTANSLIGFKEVTGNRIEYQTPYVIIPTVTGQLLNTTDEYVHEFKEERTDKTTLKPVTAGNFKMYGTLRYVSGDEAVGKYIMQSGNIWKQISSGSPSYDGACILPMRAYIVNTSSGARQYISATFTDSNGGATIIDRLCLDEDTNAAIYDLQGRKVQTPQRKGIYIVNGKIIMK